MKTHLHNLLAIPVLLLSIPAHAAILSTESFESDGEGSRYRSNQFDDGGQNYMGVYDNTGATFSSPFTNLDGTKLWGGEDLEEAANPLGPGERGYLILNTIDISSGYNSFTVDVLLGARGDGNATGLGDTRFEANDELLIQFAIDGDIAGPAVNSGSYTTIGAFYGEHLGAGNGATDLVQDTDLDGVADTGTFALTETLTNFQFSFDGVTGNELSIRIVMGQDTGSEDIALDNVRVNGSIVPEPSSLYLLGLGISVMLQRRSRGQARG